MRKIAAVALVLCALHPLAAQSAVPLCHERTRVACPRPVLLTLLVRVGATDTVTVQPGGKLLVPIIAAPGLAAIQMTLDYAATRLTLDSLRGLAPWTATLNPATRSWNAFSPYEATLSQTAAYAFFSVKARTGRTDVNLLAPFVAANASGESTLSRIVVRGLVVCVASC